MRGRRGGGGKGRCHSCGRREAKDAAGFAIPAGGGGVRLFPFVGGFAVLPLGSSKIRR